MAFGNSFGGGASGGGSGGDASTNTSVSVDSEVVLFSGTGGKTLKRATGTGTPYLTSGVLSINKVTFTQPATGSTLTIAEGKTVTINNTLTFSGTDSSSVAFGAGGTVLYSGGALGTPSSGDLSNCTNAVPANASITPAKLSGAQSGSAPTYAVRAWVNFNGTGTVAIRASGNVSSITDNGVGDYTVNFTTAMPDANYAILAASSGSLAGLGWPSIVGLNTSDSSGTPTLKTSSACRISTFDPYSVSPGAKDYSNISIAFLR